MIFCMDIFVEANIVIWARWKDSIDSIEQSLSPKLNQETFLHLSEASEGESDFLSFIFLSFDSIVR